MSDPFISEMRMFAFDFAPRGWAMCNGQVMPVSQHQALCVLIGTHYGGDGVTNFNLPDFRGRVPVGVGDDTYIGQIGGQQVVTLSEHHMPWHSHQVKATNLEGDTKNYDNAIFSAATNGKGTGAAAPIYGEPDNLVSLNPNTSGYSGGGKAHNNMQPSLALNFCIALEGAFPSRN